MTATLKYLTSLDLMSGGYCQHPVPTVLPAHSYGYMTYRKPSQRSLVFKKKSVSAVSLGPSKNKSFTPIMYIGNAASLTFSSTKFSVSECLSVQDWICVRDNLIAK
uniref:Uncharacterized protein n=1 Tax=Arion vulgaris TaxID=1028688 RepID=A0A0B7AJE6_9EUPU